ncbi:MAG: hypothetical protein LBR57_00780 [Alistipes sp.]|jgi:hypothetical protein|nr:hypothetical protein [Alistipes sp.]
MRHFFVILFTLHSSLFILRAQDTRPTVTASFDRDSVMIGDQFTLSLRVDKDMMQLVNFPELTGNVQPSGVEIISEAPADTITTDGRRQIITKNYTLTIWDAGLYNLGRLPALYVDKNVVDTLWSADSMRIRVDTFAIDLEKDKPHDIKPPLRLSLRIGEIAGWVALTLAALAVLGVGVWLLSKYRRHIPLLGGSRPSLPPHVEAIRRLEALRNQKLPQNGRHKQYYSGITDILRDYLERRFSIRAMEMTSSEIIEAVDSPRRNGEVDDKRFDDLTNLLRTADLVKFAKWVPGEADDDKAYFDAYYFVEETKLVVEGQAEESEKEI